MVFSGFVAALLAGLLALAAIVSVYDYRFRRIPNAALIWASVYALLVFAAMAFSLPIGDVAKGFLFAIMGILLGGFFLYVPYRYKQVGAGDVKLMMVFGLFLGPKGVILALLNGALIGGLWALVLAWKIGGLGHMWYNMKHMAQSIWLSGGKEMGWDLRSEGAIAMPYGVALSIGAALVAIWQLKLHIGRLLGVEA